MTDRPARRRRGWAARGLPRQAVAALAAALVALVVAPLLLLAGRATAQSTDDPGASAVTVSGHLSSLGDDYSGLRVTVSQTRDLTHQGVTISWTGGAPTQPDNGFAVNYLQIMQCWGDPQAADFRQTCQFGAGVTAAGGGATNMRDIRIDPPDPNEVGNLPADAQMVPFTSKLTGETTPDGSAAHPWPASAVHSWDVLGPYFSKYSTNEVPYARTAADGTGRIVFEVQTTVEAPHLGCGTAMTNPDGTVVGTPCSLVIVPRGSHDANGSVQNGGAPLVGSPLSATFWADRIVVPLQFQPIGGFCKLGQVERRTTGSELVAEAISSWQPALCDTSGTVFGYSTVSDDNARTLAAGANGLGFTNQPVLTSATDPPVIQAPVTLSGVVIAFNIDAEINPQTPADLLLQGQAVRQLKLTPLLVAKLLTQSYKRDVPGGQQGVAAYLGDNPNSLRNDPDFLALNPFFAKFTPQSGPDGLMTAYGDSDSALAVWRWVLADPVAADWLAGKPELMPDGKKFVVNKYYLDLAAEGIPDKYPKSDPSCQPSADVLPNAPPPLNFCTLDLRPYLNSMHETALQTLRADAKVKITYDPLKVPPQLTQSDPQPVGQRFEMAVTDSASAARFGLSTATLCDNSGSQCVDATTDSLLAGERAMVNSAVPGVLTLDPHVHTPGVYPLTTLAYAAVSTELPADARKQYATLLSYAAGAGQLPGTRLGQLPGGYAPLPPELAVRTQAAARQLAEYVSPPAAPVHPAPVISAPPTPGVVPAPVTAYPSVSPWVARAVRYTPGQHLGGQRFVLVGVLAGGLLAAVLGPVLLSAGTRRRGGGTR